MIEETKQKRGRKMDIAVGTCDSCGTKIIRVKLLSTWCHMNNEAIDALIEALEKCRKESHDKQAGS